MKTTLIFFIKNIVLLLWLVIFLGMQTTVTYSQEAPIKRFPNNCYRPQKEERYECFILLFDQNKKRVEEKKTKNRPPSEFKQKIEAERLANEERRKQEQELFRQRLEASRARNISNKGKKYRITFGRVPEPTE